MNRLLEKAAILMICILAFTSQGDLIAPVAALLISAAASSCVQIFTGTKTAAVMIALCMALCGVMPAMFCTLPLLLYDALCEKKWWLVTPAATVLMNPDTLTVPQILTVIAGSAAALIMYLRISGLESAVGKLTHLRDEVAEKNMQLASQNVKLAEAQNSSIHIATLKERNRIAREIHDNVGHMLTRSILQTGALQVINKDEKLKEPLAELKSTLDGAMTSIRASVHDLHDDSIDLKKTIEDIAASVDGRFDVSLSYDAGEHIPGDVKLCVAGVVKEAVSNAAKHSSGDRISIVFREHPAFWQLQAEDNGHPDENAGLHTDGIGLRNMEDRAASVGGRITFTPSENGFRIFMTIPKS